MKVGLFLGDKGSRKGPGNGTVLAMELRQLEMFGFVTANSMSNIQMDNFGYL